MHGFDLTRPIDDPIALAIASAKLPRVLAPALAVGRRNRVLDREEPFGLRQVNSGGRRWRIHAPGC